MTDDERAAVRAKAERLMILTTYPPTAERAVEMYELAEAILSALAPHIPAVRNTWHANAASNLREAYAEFLDAYGGKVAP